MPAIAYLKTHRRFAVMALAPAAVLVLVVVLLAMPPHTANLLPYFFGFFHNDPLGAALDLIAALAVFAHLAWIGTGTNHPRHRGWFVAGAFILGLVANGVYEMRLGHTVHFSNLSGGLEFFTAAAVFYCVYRLVVLLPLHFRCVATAGLAFYLLAMGLYQAYRLSLMAQMPCPGEGAAPVLWLEMLGRCT